MKSQNPDWKKWANHFLPFSVEVTKPRICISGEALRFTAPRKKLSCILDNIQAILKFLLT